MRQEFVLRRQLRILGSKAWLIAIAVIVFGVIAYLLSGFFPRVYESTTTLLVGQALTRDSPNYDQLLASQRLSQTYAQLATTRPIVIRVIERLRLEETPDDLTASVTSLAAIDSLFVSITARSDDAARASEIANAFADELIDASPRVVVAPSDVGATNLLSVVEPAIPADAPISPRTLMNTLLAAIVGLIVAAAIVFTRAYIADRVNVPDDAREASGLPLLGEIPSATDELSHQEIGVVRPPPDRAEAIGGLRTQLQLRHPGPQPFTVAITSSSEGEGTSLIAANLAVSLAQDGRRTILVDANVLNPMVDQLFGTPNTTGLSAMLSSPALAPASVAHQTIEPNLRVIVAGPIRSRPSELLTPTRIDRLLQRLLEDSDVVVLDCPPVLTSPETAVLSAMADGSVYVVKGSVTTRENLRHGRETLDTVGAHVFGFVFVRPAAQATDVRRRLRDHLRPAPQNDRVP